MDIAMTFGDLLQSLRKQKRINQKQLAQHLSVHRNTIGKWERGICLPDSKTIVLETAKCLGLNKQETRSLLEASLTAVSSYWNIPSPRNRFFTGRIEILQHLQTVLDKEQIYTSLQIVALNGLGGVGKTQLALEYAYQQHDTYDAIFWIAAESQESIIASFISIATLLRLFEIESQPHKVVISAVLQWLTHHKNWLLIFDNVEDLQLVPLFLPKIHHGAVIITTRHHAIGPLATTIEVSPFSIDDGLSFLRYRSKMADRSFHAEEFSVARTLVEISGGLPLAIDQAGAYIEEVQCSLFEYLDLYQKQRKYLLGRRGTTAFDHPESVEVTFSMAFDKVAQKHRGAHYLLLLCTFFASEAIPEAFLRHDHHYGPSYPSQEPLKKNSFYEAIEILGTMSIIKRNAYNKTVTIHRLQQAVLRDMLDSAKQQQLLQVTVTWLNEAFPYGNVLVEKWSICESLLPHVLECVHSCFEKNYLLLECSELLHKAAVYLSDRGQYLKAETLFQQSLSIRKRHLEPYDPLIAQSLNSLAILYAEQGQYQQARKLFEETLHIRTQIYGEGHLKVAIVMNNLAEVYERLAQYDQVEALLQEAYAIFQQYQQPIEMTFFVMNNLAQVYIRQKNYDQAKQILDQTLSELRNCAGSKHALTARVLSSQAILYRVTGRYNQAYTMFQEAVCIQKQNFGSSHPEVASFLVDFALLFMMEEKYDEAEALLQEALEIFEQKLGLEHVHTATCYHELANLFQQKNVYDKARTFYQKAYIIRQRCLGMEHPDTQKTRDAYKKVQKDEVLR